MNIAIVATVFWPISLLYTSGFEEGVQHDSALNLWVKGEVVNFLFLGNSLYTMDTGRAVHVYMARPLELPHRCAGRDDRGTR